MKSLSDTANTITILCKILKIREGLYTDIILEDLNREITDDLKYVTVVKLPYWQDIDIHVGDVGYAQFESVIGGQTKWFNKEVQDWETYKYTKCYLLSFLKTQDLCKQDKFNFE